MPTITAPSAAGVNIGYASPLAILKPDKFNKLALPFGGQGIDFLKFIRSAFPEKEVMNREFSWFENRRLVAPIAFESLSVASGNHTTTKDVVTFTVSASSIDATTSKHAVYIGQNLKFSNDIMVQVTNVSGTTITATTIAVADVIPATATGKVMTCGNAGIEGGGQFPSTITGKDELSNYIQTYRKSMRMSDMSSMFETYVADYNGKPVRVWSDMALIELDYQILAEMATDMMWGVKGEVVHTNLKDEDGVAGTAYHTEGFMRSAYNSGLSHNTTPGNFDFMLDFDEIDRLFRTQNVAGGNHLAMFAAGLINDVENNAIQFSAESTDFTSIVAGVFGGDQSRALSCNFRVMKKGMRKYFIVDNDLNSNPNFTDLSDSSWASANTKGFIAPLEKVIDPVSKEAMAFSNLMFMRNKDAGFKSELGLYQWETGGHASANKNQYSNKTLNSEAYFGMRTVGANRLMLINK